MNRKLISIKKLLLDSKNPRFVSPISAQSEAIGVFSAHKKTAALARDIATHGVNPAEQVIVMPHPKDEGFYIVLEGNRRLAALRILDDPALATSEPLKTKYKKIRTDSNAVIPDTIDCLVMKSRGEAEHWLELKHGGELDGAGLVSWGALEQARFNRERSIDDKNIPALEVYERCRKVGSRLEDDASNFPLTTLQRILDTVHVKSILGLKAHDNKLITNRPVDELDKFFKKIVTELESKNIKVDDVKTASAIKGYVDEIIKHEKLKLTQQPKYVQYDADGGSHDVSLKQENSKGRTHREKPRQALVPSKYSTSCNDKRIQQIFTELKKFNVDKFPNAGVSLLRMLLEMSTILYHKKHKLQRLKDDSLAKCLQSVLDDLTNKQSIQPFEAKPVRVLISAKRDDPRSLDCVHACLHNPRFAFTGKELIARWDELEPFIKAMCDGI